MAAGVSEENRYDLFLGQLGEEEWNDMLSRLVSSIHPVDQAATQIWFGFWPLKLSRLLNDSSDLKETARELLLDGNYRLEEQLDASVTFLYGSLYWTQIKQALAAHVDAREEPKSLGLQEQIRKLADDLSKQLGIDSSLLLGTVAVAFMALTHLGRDVFSAAAQSTNPIRTDKRSPDKILKARAKGEGLLSFLRPGSRRFTVNFDESRSDRTFQCLEAQDLSMAATTDTRDFKSSDHRRIDGPIPAECRSGSCGYCWVGVLSGSENLVEMSEHERKRLGYFGYAHFDSNDESHPLIRLACQAKCYGPVTVVIPPWNGSLDGRR